MEISPLPLEPTAFAPFGDVIDMADRAGRTYYDETLGNLRPSARPSLSMTLKADTPERPLRVTMLERHEFSSQSFIPVDVSRWLVVVAPDAPTAAPMSLPCVPSSRPAPGRHLQAEHVAPPADRPRPAGRFAVIMWRVAARVTRSSCPPSRSQSSSMREAPSPTSAATSSATPNPPDPRWPNGARLAVNFVMNYEEGAEPSVQDGEGQPRPA